MHSFKLQKAVALLGPTASGKSDMAIALAKKFNGEVVSCDSRQIYRGMDIGSGKIVPDPIRNTKYEILNTDKFHSDGICHHMIDIVSSRTEYNAAKFQKQASRAIKDILKRGKLPILCGGTGFWAEALVENIKFPGVAPNKKLRDQLNKKTASELYKQLLKLDPDRAKTLGPHNKVYIIRALEIALSRLETQNLEHETHNSKLEMQKNSNYKLRDVHWLVMALDPDREKLFEKIEKRLDERLAEGMIDEVYTLHFDKNVPWTRLDAFGLEYRWVSRYVRKQISYNEMQERINRESRHYAKRQLTYLRRWERQGRKIHWITNRQEAEKITKNFLKK